MSLKKYLTELLGIFYEVEGINMTFKDRQLEESYSKSILESESIKSIIFLFISTPIFIYCIYISLNFNDVYSLILTVCVIIGWIIEIVLALISCRNPQNFHLMVAMKYIRFLCLFMIINLILIFPQNFDDIIFSCYHSNLLDCLLP